MGQGAGGRGQGAGGKGGRGKGGQEERGEGGKEGRGKDRQTHVTWTDRKKEGARTKDGQKTEVRTGRRK